MLIYFSDAISRQTLAPKFENSQLKLWFTNDESRSSVNSEASCNTRKTMNIFARVQSTFPSHNRVLSPVDNIDDIENELSPPDNSHNSSFMSNDSAPKPLNITPVQFYQKVVLEHCKTNKSWDDLMKSILSVSKKNDDFFFWLANNQESIKNVLDLHNQFPSWLE